MKNTRLNTFFCSLVIYLYSVDCTFSCVAPGNCTPPKTSFVRLTRGPRPGLQWNINGGFCGAFSVQQAALSVGAWISQDYVRKANKDFKGPKVMHGNKDEGYEVMPSNVGQTAKQLKLSFEEWDYDQPKPQSEAFMRWIKQHLSTGNPVVWFPICKGDGHGCYRTPQDTDGACPNNGTTDHVEVMYGVYSNHELEIENVTIYDDDYIVHTSDQDLFSYFRRIRSLPDSLAMEGNCAAAQPGFGKNEMYPCFDETVTYGLAVSGLDVEDASLPRVSLIVNIDTEPNVRMFQKPIDVRGNVSVIGLEVGKDYALYRYGSVDAVPTKSPYDYGYDFAVNFTANNTRFEYEDPNPFSSHSATYYIAVPRA